MVNTDTTSTKRREFNYKNDVNVTRERKTEKEEKVASKRVKMKPHRKRKKEREKDVRGAYRIKLKNVNKNRMVIVSRMFISEDFLVNPLLSQMHLFQQSNYRLKEVANWSMSMFRPTPPKIFLKLSRVKTASASTSFTPEKKK